MNRREFVAKACMACIGGSLLPAVLASCQSAYYVTGILDSRGINVLRSEFIQVKKDKQVLRNYIIVHHDTLEFPIFLYRISESEYSALWMKCTHQGSELQAGGDHLYCTSHGSEFDKKGGVTHGPADKNLRSFPVSIQGDTIFIDLT